MKLPQNLAEIDSYLYGRLRRKWAQMREQRVAKATVNLDTDRIRGLEVPIEGVNFSKKFFNNFSIILAFNLATPFQPSRCAFPTDCRWQF
jgi:hypothetical protein